MTLLQTWHCLYYLYYQTTCSFVCIFVYRGPVIFLDTPVSVIAKRLMANNSEISTRPLLSHLSLEEAPELTTEDRSRLLTKKLEILLSERRKNYERAHVVSAVVPIWYHHHHPYLLIYPGGVAGGLGDWSLCRRGSQRTLQILDLRVNQSKRHGVVWTWWKKRTNVRILDIFRRRKPGLHDVRKPALFITEDI